MKSWQHPLGEAPPESVFILVDSEGDFAGSGDIQKWVQQVFPHLNWRFHLFLLSEGGNTNIETYERFAALAVSFLEQQGLATLHLHPVVEMNFSDAARQRQWKRLLAPAEPFQAQAYQEQGEVRLLVLPIVIVPPDVSSDIVSRAADFFLSRVARPSFCLAREPDGGLMRKADEEGIRLYVNASGDWGLDGLVGQLQINHVFDSLLPRLEEEEPDLLAPCSPHLVVDGSRGQAFACFEQWKSGQGGVSIKSDEGGGIGLPCDVSQALCPVCIGRSLLLMKANIAANQRQGEGGRVLFRTAQALSGRCEQRLAAEMSCHACELCQDDKDKGAALIQEGLCRLALGQYEKAEEALRNAAGYPVEQGTVAYYRGCVQFEWRDYIEALDRFAEAIKSGCQQVPREDIRFQMALCHINLEEYAEARPFLEQSLKPGQDKAPVSFYRGICELGEGKVPQAMLHFGEALRIGPSDDDLGRVLFYIGTCLKELERFDEAIEVLERAVRADPDDLANHNLLGFCYYKTKQHEKAVACFRRAVQIDPRSGIDWANLGSNLRDLGRIDEAVAMYEKALSLDPTLGFARQNLARLTASAPEENG